MSSSSNWRARTAALGPSAAGPSFPGAAVVGPLLGILKLREIIDNLRVDRETLAARLNGARAAGGDVGIWREAVTYAHSKIVELEEATEAARGWLTGREVSADGGSMVSAAELAGLRAVHLGEREWIRAAGEEELKREFVESVAVLREREGEWNVLRGVVDAVPTRM